MHDLGQVIYRFLCKVGGKKNQEFDVACFPLRQDLTWLDLTFARTRFHSGFGNTWSRMP